MNTTISGRRVRGRVKAEVLNSIWIIEMRTGGITIRKARGRKPIKMSLPDLIASIMGQGMLPLWPETTTKGANEQN